MAEAGVDISGQQPKRLGELCNVSLDYIVTVCDDAHESCPVFLAAPRSFTSVSTTHSA